MQHPRVSAEDWGVPGKLHQGTLELFRHDPWLAFDLLGIERPVSGTPLTRPAEVESEDPETGEPDLAFPDLVLVVEAEDGLDGIVICVEAQGELDRDKRWKLVLYPAVLANAYRVQTWMVVVSYADRMSRAVEVWRQGPPPRPDVLLVDAKRVPPIYDLDVARGRPTAAVLSAALHGCRGDVEAARTGIRACRGLPWERRRSYTQTILAALAEGDKRAVIGELNVEERREVWEIERRSGTYQLGREEGREEGREAGREAGRRATLVELIQAVLEVRGVAVDPATRERLRTCEELAVLEHWARRARDVARAPDLFVDPTAR